MNLPTVIGIIAVAAAFIAVVAVEIKNWKKGRSSCSCGCSECGMKGHCHRNK